LNTPEALLRSLGVTAAEHIELETIAWSCGLEVRFAPLAGCDARIVGKGDRGVLTVNSGQSIARQRFSLAHELGHWTLHRGRLMLCHAAEIGNASSEKRGFELDADQFAAALLMPRYLFEPAAAALKGIENGHLGRMARLACVQQRKQKAIRLPSSYRRRVPAAQS
jgi:hypothetical protein